MDKADREAATCKNTSSCWEAKIDELLALKSIYCGEGECEVISPPGLSFENLASIESSDSIPRDVDNISVRILVYASVEHVQQTTHRLCVSIVFNLDSKYPHNAPGTITELSSEHLPKHVTESIHKRLNLFITTLQPEPCLFEALQWMKEELLTRVNKDTHLLILPSARVSDKEINLCTTSDDLLDVAETDQNIKPGGITSESVCGTQVPQGDPHTVHVCIAKLDHMRNKHKYLKLLNSWAKELAIHGIILHTGSHSIYVVISGTSSSSVGEFLKRWRTRNVDVDSQGRPCKEKLLSVLCQCQLSGFVCSWSGPTGRYMKRTHHVTFIHVDCVAID